MSQVSTVLLNWNSGEDTLECLGSLEQIACTGWEHQVIVVDNGSTDDSPEQIERAFPWVDLVRNGENLGFTGGMNRGIARALEQGADFVVLLNNDTILEADAHDRLVQHAQTHENVGAVAPLIRYYDDPGIWHAGARIIRPFGRVESLLETRAAQPYRVELFTGCCVLLPRRILETIGAFDERYFIYHEDSDLSLRVAAAGHDLWVVPDSVIYHKVSRTFGGPQSPNSLYYTVRNNLLLIREHSLGWAERACGYFYMGVLTLKMSMNVFTRRFPRKRESFSALGEGWADFSRARWGQRG